MKKQGIGVGGQIVMDGQVLGPFLTCLCQLGYLW